MNERNFIGRSLAAAQAISLSLSLGWTAITAGAQNAPKAWKTIGPDGGDARSLEAVSGDLSHLYLGTTNSWIYESRDAGATWQRLSKLDQEDDLVVDDIIVADNDPSLIYAAAWKFDKPGGGLWISHDAGHTWKESQGLAGQSIRAFAQAPSNKQIMFAGTLQGIFRSNDGGVNWTQISPAGSKEIHEVESLAIDPKNPDILYAGTWHLPWKTTDGGKNWQNIKQGIIDDSDVFSIIVDPEQADVVYASACSGIYKSETAGQMFHKIQGIPSTARRTRVLKQDPVHRDTVYAGTTEGLYKTTDAGKTFKRMTGPDVIVNDVFVDPKNPDHVMLATDRSGVLSSTDAAVSFTGVNRGFSARKVEALLVDPSDAQKIYAGVVNDKTYGGVFVSQDGGSAWKQVADGLEGRDVFALSKAEDGTILAGTNSGIFALEGQGGGWKPRNAIVNTVSKPGVQVVHGKRTTVEKKVKEPTRELTSRVHALDASGPVWLAATTGGLFTSKDKGATWQGGPAAGSVDYTTVAVQGQLMAAAKPDGVVLSTDAGQSWWPMGIPTVLTRIHRLTFAPDGTLWLGAREGVYFTSDKGKSWMWVHRLPLNGVDDLYYDAKTNKILVSSRGSDFVYSIDAKSLSWKWMQTGFHLALVRAAGDRTLAASLDDGVLVESRPQGTETSSR